jgi:beta-xylosidase
VVCTNVVHRRDLGEAARENFIVSTQNIWSDQWSEPVGFDFDGIDPSIFWDDDGRSYIQGSAMPGPMTTIHQFEIDLKTGKKLSEERKIWGGSGGTWAEGPHLYKRDGWYYLLVSEGGTWENHCITVARSKDIWGPFESFSGNPILTARNSNEYIRHTGHLDVVEDGEGTIWAVCLGVRKDKAGRYTMGRESFLTSGRWPTGDWPQTDQVKVDPKGLSSSQKCAVAPTSRPLKDWLYIRGADLSKVVILDQGSRLELMASKFDLTSGIESPTFVGKRQRQLNGQSTVNLNLWTKSGQEDTKAGLACYKDEHRFVRIFWDAGEGSVVFELLNNAKKLHRVLKHNVAAGGQLSFRLEYSEQEYRGLFKAGTRSKGLWELASMVDTAELTGPDFTGPVIGVFAVSSKSHVAEFEELMIE